jgi:hypothetical protein
MNLARPYHRKCCKGADGAVSREEAYEDYSHVAFFLNRVASRLV